MPDRLSPGLLRAIVCEEQMLDVNLSTVDRDRHQIGRGGKLR